MFNEPIYFIKATKDYEKQDVRTILYEILGNDSIDRLLSIDGVDCDARVFVIAFWRVPSVNLFHNDHTEPTNYLLGREIPWRIEIMDEYPIFTDGHYPAPHFLRNSKNLTDLELDQLGIGGPGEFIYTNLPKDPGSDNHWQMYRDGTYYMPDMTYYNRPRLEPLNVIDKPLAHTKPCLKLVKKQSTEVEPVTNRFKRWRDFYIEHPKTWPSDLTEEERTLLEELYVNEYKSPWTPECGRDPTNMAEQRERLDAQLHTLPKRSHAEPSEQIGIQRQFTIGRWDDFIIEDPKTWPSDLTEEERTSIEEQLWLGPLSRQVSSFPVRELNSSQLTPFPSQSRSFFVDYKLSPIQDKKIYRSFD